MNSNNLVIGILGPTACGKTQLACEIVDSLPADIISVDSSMIYRGMDIGTAKPSAEVRKKYPHKLIDIRDPKDSYSVGNFIQDVLPAINDSIKKQKVPLLVGGTMMYFNALQNGLSDLPIADPIVRQELLDRALRVGWHNLHAELKAVDPISFERIKPNDSQRIQRALEVYTLTKKPLSSFKIDKPNYNFALKLFGIVPTNRSLLHDEIEKRFYSMLDSGLVAEVKQFYNRADLDLNLPSMRSVGYRQVWQYLSGKLAYDDMCGQVIAATRQLAKRQITWLKSWEDILLSSNLDKVRSNIVKTMS